MNALQRQWQRPRSRMVLGTFGLAALVAVIAWLTHTPATASAPPPVPNGVSVETATVARATVPLYVEGLGNVQAF